MLRYLYSSLNLHLSMLSLCLILLKPGQHVSILIHSLFSYLTVVSPSTGDRH